MRRDAEPTGSFSERKENFLIWGEKNKWETPRVFFQGAFWALVLRRRRGRAGVLPYLYKTFENKA